MPDTISTAGLVNLTAKIVASYISHNSVSIASVSSVITQVHDSLDALARESSAGGLAVAVARPAVPIKRSVQEDFIVCLEDGKRFKSLKRYLRTQYSLTPEQYRAKWRLPSDYPMVAPNYARTRSDLAKSMKLGHKPVRSRA